MEDHKKESSSLLMLDRQMDRQSREAGMMQPNDLLHNHTFRFSLPFSPRLGSDEAGVSFPGFLPFFNLGGLTCFTPEPGWGERGRKWENWWFHSAYNKVSSEASL